jgi:YccS/YhfK family integral membrane protein
MMPMRFPIINRLWSHDKMLDSLKVTIAFAGVLAFCFGTQHEKWLFGALLGVIAAALAEVPDRAIGRIKAIIVTQFCFALASFSVCLLFAYPWAFGVGLAVSTFLFVMLGAWGERYATIATASVILAIYTMLGLSQGAGHNAPFWQAPAVLLTGAGAYGLLSVLAAILFPNRPLRHGMHSLYMALSHYLTLKASLLEPIRGRDVKALRLALATQNGLVVGLMNRMRELLLLWVQNGRPARGSKPFLQWYFLAQDIHERASSAHHPYEALSEAFARSDVLFRCQRLLSQQARACARLGEAIGTHQPFNYGTDGALALAELEEASAYVNANPKQDKVLLDALADLARNISTIERGLALANTPEALDAIVDPTLRDYRPQSLGEAWKRLLQDLNPGSRRFRHGLRLSVALTAGYILLHLLNLPQGYWVMLTTVFVCQPNFSTTWRRMGQRIVGTLIGLLAVSLFISAFPLPLAQLALLVATGVAFFATRAEKYTIATACITVMVLVCFNQFGSSYVWVWPRMIDTILGSLLSVAAVTFILPEWQGKRLHDVMARTLTLSDTYLGEILNQYHRGKRDDLPYRIARRDAHNADAELSSTLTGMLGEPGRYYISPEIAYRFLCASHTLLGYVSALGAHREQIASWQNDEAMHNFEDHVHRNLLSVATALATQRGISRDNLQPVCTEEVMRGLSGAQTRVVRQLALIDALIPEFVELANSFATVAKAAP